MVADTISQNRYYFTEPTRSFLIISIGVPIFVLCYISTLLLLCHYEHFRLNQERFMLLPSEKLGQIIRFGPKFIVVHKRYLRIWGEDILVTVIIIKSECSICEPFIFETTEQYNYDVI